MRLVDVLVVTHQRTIEIVSVVGEHAPEGCAAYCLALDQADLADCVESQAELDEMGDACFFILVRRLQKI